jgi:hypothetical protein
LDLFVQACALDILQQLIGMTAEIELNMIVLITLLWPKAKVVMVSRILAAATYLIWEVMTSPSLSQIYLVLLFGLLCASIHSRKFVAAKWNGCWDRTKHGCAQSHQFHLKSNFECLAA